jgi:hypothetical protein
MITPDPEPLPPIFTDIRLPLAAFLLALALALRAYFS